ncbi:DHH family phosphoesterase [Ureibacillus sp. FSL K6-8385]|uniref:Cyclic-di-AMP phosphodiesterase n=1 Tax=Ureibacillus terrenus TaxID=118246 RepID=A0A540V2W9_9BACL|nr:DHH family phosphoesterase [Ureibacillus terrenus]MED3661630.1 DHH family phosphoesterase [Ureibacillus terrenus]MED3763608.1 DHH family phosphoesterase [Ureibacillus terrenus]TQE91092.1 DHH family phosphoesterase [Ureibacillus terrenus]
MDTYRKRKMHYPLFHLAFFGLVGIIGLFLLNVWVGLAFTIIVAIVIFYDWRKEKISHLAIEKYIESLAFRMKKVGQEVLLEMPIGVILINDKFEIEWANPYMTRLMDLPSLTGQNLFVLSDELQNIRKSDDKKDCIVTIQDRKFKVLYKQAEKLLYFLDVTEQVEIEKQYHDDRTVIAILFIDNYDDITQGMDDQTKSMTSSTVTSIINEWAEEHDIYIKRIDTDRFLAILNEATLHELERKKFSILDDIREKTAKKNLSLTLSIGVGAGSPSLIELGELAQSSLDLVLGRGGDQVAIKQPNGKIKFYGGKTNPVEKRTRVRARVISHALKDLIQDSDSVFIMGHKNPDMDSIGAGVGVRKMAEMNKVNGYIVLDFDELNGSVKRLMDVIKKDSDLIEYFISPDEALSIMTENSLLVVVDTHRPSLVVDETLLKRFEKIVVIDHHRRGEEFIKNSTLVYMEPYASSTSELVTELLEYQPDDEKLSSLEATALLAGIIVDTKSFTLRTGARTFEAASYLRSYGADTVLVQRLLKEDIDTFIMRSKIIQTAQFIYPGIAVAHGEEDKKYDTVLIAQTADILLTMKDVNASFVIARRQDGLIGISARSLGDVNVQVIMEKLGGGGHLSNAACQLEAETIEEALILLKDAITETLEGSSEK